MKKYIHILFIIVGLFLISFNLVKSFFTPSAFFRGVSFKVGDFVPPSVISLADDTIYTNQPEYLFSWDQSFDYKNNSEPVYYRFAINAKEYRTDINQISLDLRGYQEGEYLFKVRACDYLNNCSSWSNEQSLVIDRTVPNFDIFIDDFIVRESIFDNLTKVGDGEQTDQYLQISDSQSTSNWSENYVSYTVSNKPRLKYLAFDYLVQSSENLKGFDQAQLVVTVNDQLAFYQNYIDENDFSNFPNESDQWQKAIIDLSIFNTDQLTIKFLSGNSGDNQFASWVKIKDLSTNFILEEDASKIIVKQENKDNQENLELLTTSLINNGEQVEIIVSDLANNIKRKEVKLFAKTNDFLIPQQIEEKLNQLGIIYGF